MKNARTRYLPLIIAPAIMPAVLMPVLVSQHLPDILIGGAFGVSIGLAIVGLVRMKRGGGRCATTS
ncbi:hypothetical protein C8J47_0118 [Sphingomonas sp. PP-F2F-G114-C0414]|uniref:hypothetical protein n=1 Tax=Sphingomonas sp. PP-F2F-G114-C0414 TaxID=2135662 RepID=UPI000EF950D9|nr:hypothetical protein [Sphingomonas sp. PP-F2F-G114-C0414]RMB39194.1 hypothetical protein C8J47_0118 [Sphingomonas sp. PP-F2F-G114-C0414]